MDQFITIKEIDEAVDNIRKKSRITPRVGMILGSGLGEIADLVEDPDAIASSDIPFWPKSTVMGHSGQLILGNIHKKPVMVMQGRAHFYEGYAMDVVTFPVRVMLRMGVQYLIITNAAGAVNPEYNPGDVMLITDHISLIGMAGSNPLRGPNIDELGERFPDMSQPYDRSLIALAESAAKRHGIHLHRGVYTCLSGPSFETPADLRFLRTIGVDAVGMSTVPEVIVARHGKCKVIGLSGISNKANLDGSVVTTHEEVLAAGKMIVPQLKSIILDVLDNLDMAA